METVELNFPGGKRIDARVGDFTIRTDQSKKRGGEGADPEPFDLFLASLAACAGIYAWNFCQSRDLSTEGIALRMECLRDEKKKMITRIEFNLKLPAGFPEKYRAGMVRAMDLCAVKKHMLEAPEFAINVEE